MKKEDECTKQYLLKLKVIATFLHNIVRQIIQPSDAVYNIFAVQR